MRRFKVAIFLPLILIVTLFSCKKNESTGKVVDPDERIAFDSTKVDVFFKKYPDYKDFKVELLKLYRKQNFHYVWFDNDGRVEFAEVLYDKASQIEAEGIPVILPYKDKIEEIFAENKKPDVNDDLLISAMYLFYAKKAIAGLDVSKSKATGWYLPREKISYISYLDTLMRDPDLIKKDESETFSQYYNLRKGLQHYRDIQKKGGWSQINFPKGSKSLKQGDSSVAIAQTRTRLFMSGDLKSDSKSAIFDGDLLSGLQSYAKKQQIENVDALTVDLVKSLNIPVDQLIKKITVNMERCRWISADIEKSNEYIAVNIPSFKMRYVHNGKTELESNVVVGKELNQTVVFSGKMTYLVFSPFWNIPKSIIEKEVNPGMERDKNYLDKHNMEWNGGNVRQKPGKDNSLGLVKFMFPNSLNIYLHDTPAKSLFDKQDRALSHGCVRVEKARELAITLLKDDKKWNAAKIDAAMHSGKEENYSLKRKIPVYIAYFTAWADADGNVAFYDDVYNRDNRLAKLLYK